MEKETFTERADELIDYINKTGKDIRIYLAMRTIISLATMGRNVYMIEGRNTACYDGIIEIAENTLPDMEGPK